VSRRKGSDASSAVDEDTMRPGSVLCPDPLPPGHDHSEVVTQQQHPFNGALSGTTRVSRYQKGKTNLDFTEETVGGCGVSWEICMSAPRPRQIPRQHPTTQHPTTQPVSSEELRSSQTRWESSKAVGNAAIVAVLRSSRREICTVCFEPRGCSPGSSERNSR